MVTDVDIAKIPMQYRRIIGTMAAEFAAQLQREGTTEADIRAETLLGFMMTIVDPMCSDTSDHHTAQWLILLNPSPAGPIPEPAAGQ